VYGDLVELPPDSELAGWPRSDLPARLREQLAHLSPAIGFVDLTAALKARAAAGELVYLPDDTHWTPAGHAAVARALAEHLEQRRR
jgi:hypothetical protein